MPAADKKKMFTATVQSWEPSYKWPKGKTVGAFRVSVDHDEECYYLSERQYKQYAGDAAVWTTLPEQIEKGTGTAGAGRSTSRNSNLFTLLSF